MFIRQFKKDDLESAAKLCRLSMDRDIMSDYLFKEKVIDETDFNEEMTLLAFDDEDSQNPIGFIMGVIKDRETEKIGYIKLLAVSPNHRRKGIASSLYRQVENVFKKMNIKKIRVYESYPNYFMPGVDPFYTEAVAFFERHGFKKFSDTANLSVDLLRQNFDTEKEEAILAKEGFVIRRAEEKDFEKVINWIDKEFHAWISEVNESFKNSPVSLFICEEKNEIKAFSAHECNNKGTGWFGPMGTNPSLRGKGIGGILYKKSLKDLKDMGYNKAIIPWVGPLPFYLHYSNAHVERIFWRYEKLLS